MKNILLTGATGYVGGRLLPVLEDKGYQIRCLSKNPENIAYVKSKNITVFKADLLDYETTFEALKGIDTAIYLVHALRSKEHFEEIENKCAENFALAAKNNNVKRIIYLGGLGRSENLSKHLKSRHKTGEILKLSGVTTIEFRASIVIGSGSISFELARSLAERLPIIPVPKLIYNKAQPISIEDILMYLIEAIELKTEENKIFEIGGADRVSYADIIQEYSMQKGLQRFIIPVPFLSTYLASLWLGLITPVYANVGRKLLESVKNPTVVEDECALETFKIRPKGIKEAIKLALEEEETDFRKTYWATSASNAGCKDNTCLNLSYKNYKFDSRKVLVRATPEQAFSYIQQIGGKTGWYYGNYLWKLRGYIDLLFGGAGLRRGRRDPVDLRQGDVLDWWRVEKFEKNKVLRLRSEMLLPGRGWLEFSVESKNEYTELSQVAIFYPKGFWGLTYWYVFKIPHNIIFSNMLKKIKDLIEKNYLPF